MSKRFLNFFNPKNNSDRIYTREDIGQMSADEFANSRDAIYHQMLEVGVPAERQIANSADAIYVRPYTREDGTKVRGYYRARRGSTFVEQAVNVIPTQEEIINNGIPLPAYISNIPQPDTYIKAFDFRNHPLNTFHSAINAGLNKNYPITKETMDMFIHGVENYPLNNGVKLHTPGHPPEYLAVLDENRKPPKNCYGIEFTEDSEISKQISLSQELKDEVVKNIQKDALKTSFPFDNNRDLSRSFHNVDILNCKDDGFYYTGYLYDIFDFEPDYYYEYGNSNLLLGAANLYAWGMDFVGAGKKYYMVIPFKIKK